jgi:hypothetical protein
MKTILCVLPLMAALSLAQAQETYSDADYETAPVAYTEPVVYQMPVTYQAPVIYYAPVYYLASTAAATAACYSSCEREYSSPSTVIHLTNGRGTYVSSNYGSCRSTVVYIGSRYARRD